MSVAVASQRTDVGDAPAQRSRAEFADPPEGGFDSEDAAERSGDADRAAAVRADGDGDKSRRDSRRRAAGTSACVVVHVVWVARRAVMRVQPRHVDADLVHVGLADQQRARRPHPRHHGCIFCRRRLTQKRRADFCRVGRHVEFIFHRHRHTVENAERLACFDSLRGFTRLPHHILAVAENHSPQRRRGCCCWLRWRPAILPPLLRAWSCRRGRLWRSRRRWQNETRETPLPRRVAILFLALPHLLWQAAHVINRMMRRRFVDDLLPHPGNARAFQQAGNQQPAQRTFQQRSKQFQQSARKIGQFDRLQIVHAFIFSISHPQNFRSMNFSLLHFEQCLIGILQIILLKFRFDIRFCRHLQKLAHVGAGHIGNRLDFLFHPQL